MSVTETCRINRLGGVSCRGILACEGGEDVKTDAVMTERTAVPPDKAGSASAVSETAYELGVALGIALLGSLLATLYRAGLNTESLPPAERSSLRPRLQWPTRSRIHLYLR